MTHALHYASAVFEGMRAYETPQGPAIFKAKEHFVRLENSGKIYHMKAPFSVNEMTEATQQLIKANQLKSCYIRPIWYYGYGKMGLNPGTNPVDAVIAAWEWGSYLGEEGLAKGIRCKISSWARVDSRVLPATAKSAANYANSALANIEAKNAGYDEAIQLNINGTVSEGPGENIFMIKDGELFTPPSSDNALQGITAQTAVQIAKDLGYSVTTRSIARDELFIADELFFTGTAAEITPIREIDGREIGIGKRGPITEKIQTKFFEIVKGQDKNYSSWLTYC